MKPVPVDLKKISDIVDNKVLKESEYNADKNCSDTEMVTNTGFNTKIKKTEDKICDVRKLVTCAAFNAKIKEIEDLNKKIAKLATKAELKVEQDKIVKLQTHDLSYFIDKNGDDGFQSMLSCQARFSRLNLKKGRDIDSVFSLKSKGMCGLLLCPQLTAFFV